MISHFQDGESFQLNPLVTTGRLRILRRIVTSQIRLSESNNIHSNKMKKQKIPYCQNSSKIQQKYLRKNHSSCWAVMIVWQLDLQLPKHSVPITTYFVSSKLVHGEVYSIQHYVIKFVDDLRQVGGFHKKRVKLQKFLTHRKGLKNCQIAKFKKFIFFSSNFFFG